MKYWVKLSLATALAAGLISLYFLDEKWSQQKTESEKVEMAALPFEQAQARRVRLVLPQTQLVFERKEASANWTLVEPSRDLKLEQSAVSSFVSTLSELSSSMEIADTEAVLRGGDKSGFGLDKPVATVEVVLDGNVSKTLNVGADVEIGTRSGGRFEAQAVYAESTERKSVFVVNKPALAFLQKTLADFRTKSPVELDVASVESFSVSPRTGEKIVLEKADGAWKVKSPREIAADESNVSTFLSTVSGMKVDKVTEKEMLRPNLMATFGLDSPAAVLEFRGASSKILATVRLGKTKDAHYVAMADGAVGSLSGTVFGELVHDLKYFRDKRVMRDVKMSDVVKIRTASAKEFQREGGEWYLVNAPTLSNKGTNDVNPGVSPTPNTPGRAASNEAKTLFADWEFLAANDVLDGPALKAMSSYGLDKPKKRFAFVFQDAKAPAEEIWIGNKVSNDPKLVYVKRANRSAVYLVDAGWLENLAKLDDAKAQPSK